MGAPEIEWDVGDLPRSAAYGDVYFSGEDGAAESRHVFLEGNDLPGRWAAGAGAGSGSGFVIGELGFGFGRNFLAAALLWERLAPPGRLLDYVGFELAPPSARDRARALARFPALAAAAERLLPDPLAPGLHHRGRVRLRLIEGDARRTLPRWAGAADAWFLDGFAPARNPELWEPGLLALVFARTTPGGTLATYSAAGAVRAGLSAAGFAVERRPGHGRKRWMTRARRPGPLTSVA